MRSISTILDSTLVTLLVVGGLSCTSDEDTGHDCDPGTHWDGSTCVPDEADTDADADADTDSDTDYTVCDDGIAPYADIQEAVDGEPDGAVISVCPGSYGRIEVKGRMLTIHGSGSDDTLIESKTRVALAVYESVLSFSGFSLSGRSESGGSDVERLTSAIYSSASTLELTDLNIRGNDAFQAVRLDASDVVSDGMVFRGSSFLFGIATSNGGSITMRHCIFDDTQPAGTGKPGSMLWFEVTDATVTNCLFINNWRISGSDHLLEARGTYGTARIYNNVFWNNSVPNIIFLVDEVDFRNNIVVENSGIGVTARGSAVVEYNDLWNNSGGDIAGTTNEHGLSVDPWFQDPANGDLSLSTETSPCIDAGDPATGYNDPDGSRNDIGAYGGSFGDW